MADVRSESPLAVVALGGNALLPRGLPTTAANQSRAARAAAQTLGPVAAGTRLVVTHGNGPQVGLLSLKEQWFTDGAPYPLDVLDAESAGQLGYVLELELSNAVVGQDTVAVLTRVVVEADDPAFVAPRKFIGPNYTEAHAERISQTLGWSVRPDGKHWRRVVASPEPKRIVELSAIQTLIDAGFLVVCVGGGGIPVVVDADRHQAGVEAVVDKDLSSAILAIGIGADLLILATDVDAVYSGWGTPEQHPIGATTPADLRALPFPEGSMGPKVEAVCRFVEATGGRAAIGALDALPALIAGTAGTQISRRDR